jgi:hypothetical protein
VHKKHLPCTFYPKSFAEVNLTEGCKRWFPWEIEHHPQLGPKAKQSDVSGCLLNPKLEENGLQEFQGQVAWEPPFLHWREAMDPEKESHHSQLNLTKKSCCPILYTQCDSRKP